MPYPANIYFFKVNNRDKKTLWTYFTLFSSVSIVDFEQVIVSWVESIETSDNLI